MTVAIEETREFLMDFAENLAIHGHAEEQETGAHLLQAVDALDELERQQGANQDLNEHAESATKITNTLIYRFNNINHEVACAREELNIVQKA